MATKVKTKVLKFNMEDPRDIIAYETLTSGTGAKKKMLERILNVYESDREEELPVKVIFESVDQEVLRKTIDEVVTEKLLRFERKLLSSIKSGGSIVVDDKFEEDVIDSEFKPNATLKGLVNIISSE